MKFIAAYEELNKVFEQIHFWKCFSTFDPLELPENISKIRGYRNGELEILIIHYGKTNEDTFKGITNTQNPNIDKDKTCVEWQGFTHFMYLKRDAHRHKIDIEMQSCKEDEKEKKALKRRENFGPHNLLKEMKIDDTLPSVYPNCIPYPIFLFMFISSEHSMHIKALLLNETYQYTFEK